MINLPNAARTFPERRVIRSARTRNAMKFNRHNSITAYTLLLLHCPRNEIVCSDGGKLKISVARRSQIVYRRKPRTFFIENENNDFTKIIVLSKKKIFFYKKKFTSQILENLKSRLIDYRAVWDNWVLLLTKAFDDIYEKIIRRRFSCIFISRIWTHRTLCTNLFSTIDCMKWRCLKVWTTITLITVLFKRTKHNWNYAFTSHMFYIMRYRAFIVTSFWKNFLNYCKNSVR